MQDGDGVTSEVYGAQPREQKRLLRVSEASRRLREKEQHQLNHIRTKSINGSRVKITPRDSDYQYEY